MGDIMIKQRVLGYIVTVIIITVILMLRFKSQEIGMVKYNIVVLLISIESAALINILFTKLIGRIYDDMEIIQTDISIFSGSGLVKLQFAINICVGISILIMLTNTSYGLYNILKVINNICWPNLIINLIPIYIGNKYALIRGCIVKLDDIQSVTKNEPTRDSDVGRNEFIVMTKQGKQYRVSCDKGMENNIGELSKGIIIGM